jgi:hypothetical protein
VHKYNDVVAYQMGDVTVPAFVVQSNPQPDGEHLVVVYLDPNIASSSMAGALADKAIAKAFPSPLTEGKTYGWKEWGEYRQPTPLKAVELTHPSARIDGPIAPAGTVYVDSEGKPRGVSDGTRIVAHDVPLTPVLGPDVAGSGTGRYGDGADHWTQTGDGKDYPGSYGVGPDAIKAGDSVRVLGADGAVDPQIHKVVGVGPDSVAVDDGISYPRDRVVRVIPESQKKAWTPAAPKGH